MRDFNIGVKNTLNESLSTDVGFKQKYLRDIFFFDPVFYTCLFVFSQMGKSVYASGLFNHPSVMMKAGLEGFITPVMDPTSLSFSSMFGHQFDSVGLLAGFDLKKSPSGSLSLRDINKVAVCGVVFPSAMLRFEM